MFDFTISSITHWGIIYCAVFYFFMLWRYGKILLDKDSAINVYANQKGWFIFLFFVFVITSWTNGDWFHYQADVKNFAGTEPEGLEMFYNVIISFVHNNYLLFRIIVWGLASFFLYCSFKSSELIPESAMMFLFCIYIDYFDYSRSALGISCYMLGFSLLTSLSKSKKIKLLSLLFIGLSICFHRSMAVLILLTPFCFLKVTRRNIILIIMIAALLSPMVNLYFQATIFDLMDSSDEGLAARAQLYGNSDRGNLWYDTNALGWISTTWRWSINYVAFIVCTKYYLINMTELKLRSISNMYTFTLLLLLLATIIYFSNFGHLALFYRIYNMSFVALTILTCYLYQHDYMPRKSYRSILFYGGGYMIFTWLYRCYSGV